MTSEQRRQESEAYWFRSPAARNVLEDFIPTKEDEDTILDGGGQQPEPITLTPKTNVEDVVRNEAEPEPLPEEPTPSPDGFFDSEEARQRLLEKMQERGLTKIKNIDPFPEEQRSLGQEAAAGVARSVDQSQAMGFGLLGLMGEVLEVQGLSDLGVDGYKRNMEEAAKNQASIQNPFEEIGGVGDAALYATGILSENIINILTSATGAGIGMAAAKGVAGKVVASEIAKRIASGMEKEAAEAAVAKLVAKNALLGAGEQAMKAGAVGGAYVANVGQIAGGSFGEIEQETGLRDPVNALGFALVGGALETAGEAVMAAPIARKLIGSAARGVEGKALGFNVGPGARVAGQLAGSSAAEGGTEYVQTGLEQAAVASADPNRTFQEVVLTPEAERERQLAATAGAVAGGGMGAASQAASYLIPETARAVQTKLAQRQAAQEPVTPAVDPQSGQALPVLDTDWSEPRASEDGVEFRVNGRGQVAIFNPDEKLSPIVEGLPRFQTSQGQTYVPLFGTEYFIRRGDDNEYRTRSALAAKGRALFDDEQATAAPAPAARKPAPQKPAVETTLDEGPDLTPAAQAVGARARFSGYEGAIAQDGARFLLRADDGTEVEVPADGEVEVVPAPEPTRLAAAPIPAVQTPAATTTETPTTQPEPLPDMAAMGAEEISRAALARPEVGIIDRAAESPDEMDANAVSLLRDARTTLEDSINEIENRDLDAETKSKLTTPLYEKFVKADDTLGKVPADATTQLDREIERKRQEAEQAKAERAKVAAQTVNRPPSQSEQFVNSLKQGDGVTIYLSGDQAPDALSFNGRFERKRNDGTVFVTTEPDAEGKTQRMAFRPNEYNRIGMLRPAPPKESPVESAVKSVLGPKPTKAKAERVLGTPYTQGEAQPVFLDDGLYQNPGKSNKVPAVVRYFDKPGEPGVKEVVTFGQWNGNKRSTPFVTVRQMSEGLDVPVPDADLQNLPQGVQVEPRVMKNGQTANVVTKVEYQGNVYRRGDTAYDFSVNGKTTGPGGFREIYLNSPERLARSERARRGKETSKAKAGPGAVQSMLDGLDEADQFFVSDARARAAQFIDRRTDLDDEAKKMAADEADASIIEQIASRTKRGIPPVSDLALFKRFNNRMLDIFESNQENETEANVGRDVQEAARQISDELVAGGQTPQEAKAAVDPIVARWQSYGSFSPIKTAMTKVQSAKKAAVRSGQNRRAAEADIAAGTVGEVRRAMTPAERFNERTTDAAMTGRELAAKLDEEDKDILNAFKAEEPLSESDQLRVEDLLEYIQGNKTYDEIYPSRAGSSEEAGPGQMERLRPGETRDVYGDSGQLAQRGGQIRVPGVTESRGTGANRAGIQRGRDRVGRTDGGEAGTIQGSVSGRDGRSGVAGTPNQRNASAARRAFLGSFIRNQDLIALLPEATVERIYQAVSTTLDALAATRGRRVVAAVQPNMADLLGMSVRDLVAGYREEFTSYQANRERVDAIRTNAEEAVRSRLFEGPQAALEFIAQDQERPAFMRLIAQTMLNQAKRFGIDLNNIAMQVGIFRRQPPTGAQSGPAVRALVEEVEGAFNVTTPDGVETFEFGEGIGMTRKQAGKAARARAYDIVTGQTRTSWAGVLGVNPLADTPAGRYSAVLNLDNWHEGNDIGLTMLHEISHIFSETKFDGRENLNAVEKAAIKGLESFRVRMLKAVARANGLEVPSGNNPADIARLSKRVDDLSNPNVAGADADRRLAYLVSPNETARGLMESPDFLQLAIEVGLGDTRKRQNTVELTGPLAEAWNAMTELEAGRKVDPTSPLGRAFKDAWSATFGALDGATEGYVKPPVGANPLAQELSALNEAADFIEEQVAARGLDGTTAERDALLQEFMASRNMVQGAETTEAPVNEDEVADPVTMSRAVDPSDLIQVGQLVRVTAKDANGKRFKFFARPGTDSTMLGVPIRVFQETDKDGATLNRTTVVQANLIESEQPLAMSKTYGEWVPAPTTESRAVAPSQENIPGSRSRLLEGLANAPYETKLDYHQQVNAALIDPETGNDTVAEILGMPSPVIETTGPSVYSPSPGVVEFNPADILSGFNSVEDATRYMILRGAFTNQNAVAGLDPQEGGEKEAARFNLGRVPNEQEVRQIYALLAKPDDTAIFLNKSGFSVVKLGFDDSHTPDVWVETIDQLQNLLRTPADSFAANTVYHENEYDLSTNPADDEYGLKFQTAATQLSLREASAGRSPDLQRGAAVRLRERLARINQAFADQGFGSPDAAPSRLLQNLGLETPTESRALPTQANENRDPYFGNESSISRGPQEGGPDPSRPTGESQRIARSVYEAGGAIRDAALRVLEEKGLVRRGISLRSEKEIRTVSRAIARYLVFSDEQLNAATTPAERTLSDAVRSFREKVPLIPKAQIEQLISSEADPLAVLDTAVDRFESGIIPEDRFGRALGELAKRYGVTIGSDLDAAVATLRGYFEENPSAGATWVIEGQGAESKAYKDDNNVIYKVAPVREDLLSAAPIGRGSLTIADNQPPFFDRDGRMPIFDRLLASNNLPIHTPTEIIGFVDDGRIVIKQPYLEKAEPDAGDLVTRAKNSGIAVLPSQKEDPKFGGDINTAPLVFRIDGEPWLALDFNPRNSRMFNGKAIPFDLIFRKLTEKDIATNKDIKQGLERLSTGPTESRARGRVWRPITKTTPTGGKISQGGMFSVDELLDKRAGDAYRDSRAQIRADVSRIQELSRNLERQMKSLFKGQTPPLETINTALGNLENPLTSQQLDEIERLRANRRPKQAELKRTQYLRENRKRFKEVTQPQALAQLPEALAETVREMSSHIESLSRRLPQEGLVNGDLAITIDEALGTYLNRSYAIFDDPKWSDTVRKNAKVMDAARKYIRNSIVQSKVIDLIDDAKADGRTLSKEEAISQANDSVPEDQIEGILEGYLAIGDESPTIEILSGRIPGQKNLSMLNRRGNIAPEIQALWGRYEDPTVNYAKTVMKLSSLVANNQFLTELRDMGIEEGWLWSRENNPNDDRHPPGYIRISSEGNPTLAPIAGMYAHPMLAEGLFKMFPVGSTEEHYWWLRSAMKLTGVSMAMKTVGSVASQIRNYLGNYLNLIAGGNLGLGDIASGDFARRFQNSTDLVLANTFNKYRNATRAEWRAKIDDYIRRGIVGESITTGLLEDLLTASRRAGSPDWGDYVWNKVSTPFKNVADFATRTYSAGDDWFKVMIYEAEQDKYRKAHPDWDDEQVKQRAAEIARDIHWTYSLAPAVVQDLKKFPFVAPFVTFTTEVIRTTYNMMKLARQEIMEGRATGNKELENIGWKRVRGMTTAAFLPAAVGTASMALAGISGDDEEDLRRFLPDWQKNSQLLLFRKDNGEVSFVDISFLDPYEYFKKPLVAFTRSLRNADSADEILLDGTMSMVRQALDPFTSEQIFAGAIMDVMRNQDAAGRQVYNPQDTGANIGTAVARKIFIDPFTPGTFNSLDRIGKAAFGIQSESGRAYSLFNELSSVMAGQRVSEMDAQQALQFKGSRFMRELRDASALFNREFVAQGTRSAGDVVSGYERSNASRRALIEGIRNDYMAAIRLGVPVQRAKAILRDAGLGRETLKMVTTGIYRPFDASEQSLDLVRSRGNTDRISAYNQAKRNAPSREVLP